jgi:hypothetical protein
MSHRVEQMQTIQTEALELFIKKNADYGDAFAKYGVIGVLMRMEDKLHRCMSISNKGVNLINDEGMRDTLIDLHNYSAMALMLLDEKDDASYKQNAGKEEEQEQQQNQNQNQHQNQPGLEKQRELKRSIDEGALQLRNLLMTRVECNTTTVMDMMQCCFKDIVRGYPTDDDDDHDDDEDGGDKLE